MKVRIVCSGTKANFNFEIHQAFIYDQIQSIIKLDSSVQFEYFFIEKGGFSGYFNAWRSLVKEQKQNPCNLIHAHGGLPALLSVMQFKEPVVSTFHGSDINISKVKWFSAVASFLSKKSIYVSQNLLNKAIIRGKAEVIPCGVDLDLFKSLNMHECRKLLGLDSSKKYVLFSSAFDNPVKNFGLLKDALELWPENPPEVIELKGVRRESVPFYMNAANVCVLTSFSEGSPQFVKEAMACNRPVVATNVGDISELFGNSINCRFTTFEPSKLYEILFSLVEKDESNGRSQMQNYELGKIASQVLTIYQD